MNPEIEIEVLESADMGNGRLMPERVICADVRRSLGDEITDEQVAEAIATLKARGEIIGSKHRDLGKRYKLTDEGKLRLKEST